MIIYLLHEIYDRWYPDNYNDPYQLAKKFARIAIISFIFYYVFYFSFPIDSGYRHFLGRMIYVDVFASVVFYGGLLKFLGYWTTGVQAPVPPYQTDQLQPDQVQNPES